MAGGDPVSWPELLPSGPGKPPALTLRETVLGGLAEAVLTRRHGHHDCNDCQPGQDCAGRTADLAIAAAYEAAFMRIRGIGSDGAMLTLTGGLTS
jgi:hypothetical protein